MTPQERFLAHRVGEEWLWLRLNANAQATREDALEYLRSQCGYHNGHCRYVTSAYCEIDCPYRPEDWPC